MFRASQNAGDDLRLVQEISFLTEFNGHKKPNQSAVFFERQVAGAGKEKVRISREYFRLIVQGGFSTDLVNRLFLPGQIVVGSHVISSGSTSSSGTSTGPSSSTQSSFE